MPDFNMDRFSREELDEMGTGAMPDSMKPKGAKKQSLSLGKKSTSSQPTTLQEKLEMTWICSMLPESGILQKAFEERRFVMDLKSASELARVRLRLYRAKRLFQRQGNKYVDVLTFRVVNEHFLVIEHAENLKQYEVTNPAILEALGLKAG